MKLFPPGLITSGISSILELTSSLCHVQVTLPPEILMTRVAVVLCLVAMLVASAWRDRCGSFADQHSVDLNSTDGDAAQQTALALARSSWIG
ncbi:hypothetical protein ElyMa_003721500 [Elysia marginata]|uniref:Uncharacterized protein n=1 Tax=Elysia marginata TaxID=1093978 RepID=A0AAV4F4B9_9GAST|nr:hypothetical protein ElyMa_003721500 [Elysia marginata]